MSYFNCAKNTGVFVQIHQIKKLIGSYISKKIYAPRDAGFGNQRWDDECGDSLDDGELESDEEFSSGSLPSPPPEQPMREEKRMVHGELEDLFQKAKKESWQTHSRFAARKTRYNPETDRESSTDAFRPPSPEPQSSTDAHPELQSSTDAYHESDESDEVVEARAFSRYKPPRTEYKNEEPAHD